MGTYRTIHSNSSRSRRITFDEHVFMALILRGRPAQHPAVCETIETRSRCEMPPHELMHRREDVLRGQSGEPLYLLDHQEHDGRLSIKVRYVLFRSTSILHAA